MNSIGCTFRVLSTLALVALGIAGRASAGIIIVDESITYADPPTPITSASNPFDFLFTSLPTSPLIDGNVEFTGLADLAEPDEFFTVFVDGQDFGIIAPASESFLESINIPMLTLTSLLADGGLLVRVNFSDEVNFGLFGDFITTRLTFDASVPEPASFWLMAVALAGMDLLRRSRRGGRV